MRVPLTRLHSFVTDVFRAVDVTAEHAATTSSRLIEADLRGRTGHGVIRVPSYVARIQAGGINLRPDIVVTRQTPVSGLVQGDNGLGQVVMTLAVETAIEKAAESGMAWVGTVRSNHAGAAGVYTEMAAAQGMIAVYLAVASANVMPPWGGRDRLLGTNPISIAIPGVDGPEFLLDIATTVASHGTIKVLAQRGEQMPEGWVMRPDGTPITDPRQADEGFLTPIGGYKGSGLNMAIGLLAGTLNGAAFAGDVIDHRAIPDREANTGQAIFVMRPDLFRDLGEFTDAVRTSLAELRSAGQPHSVKIPGDLARDRQKRQLSEGVELSEAVAAGLDSVADQLGLGVALGD
ncbi:MAG TPA: Ldh family oxidoreductase [Acidimicrobiia bacterium]|nr:Ldh family oxidoreductase [Acidimicrobiia bacterium]